VRFSMDLAAQLKAFQDIDDAGLELLGIFHSHPGGPPEPSPTDIAEFFYPGTVSMILSRDTGVWRVRSFWIEDGQVDEVPLVNPLSRRRKR
jgi:desampylase